MKHINFKKLSIINFLSVGKEPVVINFEQGINIITGINKDMADRRNGVGKSTIADALYFAIFGTTIRELKKDFISNSITNGTCAVELEFDVASHDATKTYRVVRTLNPTKCYLFEDGVDVTRDSIANTSQTISDLIDASPSIFQNCVIMTLNGTIPFMAQSKVDKRKFIESIFNLQVFSKMLTHVRDDYNDNKKLYDLELFKLNETQSNLSKFENQKQSILSDRASKFNSLQSSIESKQTEKEQLQQHIDAIVPLDADKVKLTIEALNKGCDKCQEVIDEMIQKTAVAEIQIKNITTKKNAIGTDEDVCPKCLKPLECTDHEHLEKEKQMMQQQIQYLQVQLTGDRGKLDDAKNKKDEIKKLISKNNQKLSQHEQNERVKNEYIRKIDVIDEHLKTIDDYANTLKCTTTEVDKVIEDNKDKLLKIEKQVAAQLEMVNLLNTMKVIVSEEGVKAYIIKKILTIFNSKLQHYLNRIGFNCTCKFNELFEEEILNDKGKACSYFNFSGAERKSIDLACLFAFIDIRRMQGNVAYNVVFYDELLDTSLDDKGVELVYDIIADRAKKYTECAYIITHRKESVFFATSKVIYLEKNNGITKRVE
jgi:DNA repair exonuclease SbcCD ATPase subunit